MKFVVSLLAILLVFPRKSPKRETTPPPPYSVTLPNRVIWVRGHHLSRLPLKYVKIWMRHAWLKYRQLSITIDAMALTKRLAFPKHRLMEGNPIAVGAFFF